MNDHLTSDGDLRQPANAANIRLTAILVVAVLLVGLAGFAGWFAHGDTLFWSLLQAGLAWCM